MTAAQLLDKARLNRAKQESLEVIASKERDDAIRRQKEVRRHTRKFPCLKPFTIEFHM